MLYDVVVEYTIAKRHTFRVEAQGVEDASDKAFEASYNFDFNSTSTYNTDTEVVNVKRIV